MSPLMYLKSLGYQQNVKTNGVWTKTTVKSILTNQAYIGSAVHGKVVIEKYNNIPLHATCLLYTSPSPRDRTRSRMPSSA